MISFSIAAKVIRALWNRNTPEPDFAFTAGAITDKNGNPTFYIDPTSGLLVSPGSVPSTQTISATGAGVISIKSGTVFLTATGAATVTLAAPTSGLATAGGDDGKKLLIESTTAQAHTVTQTTPGFNNGSTASDVATFGTAIGNSFEVVAKGGVWYVANTPKGVTLG